MSYGETKVYFDGSHYIAIPHTERPLKRRPKPIEEVITVVEEERNEGVSVEDDAPVLSVSTENVENITNIVDNCEEIEEHKKIEKKMTKKELFNSLYKKYINEKRSVRKKLIIDEMLPYFTERQFCEAFVSDNFDRKLRNIICRRVRMVRKANLINFNYFCTFTYDDKLHSEVTFKKKLKIALQNLATRNGWKYMGVWERAPKTKRLHFHGMFSIPDGQMVGELIKTKDYSFATHNMQETCQNSYFLYRFGRCDFEPIEGRFRYGEAITYLLKYIEKTEEKIVYSKGLYQYFMSDIMDEDVVCKIGQEEKKLLLFDDFNCWDEGVLIGKVCPEVIAQMRKCNA